MTNLSELENIDSKMRTLLTNSSQNPDDMLTYRKNAILLPIVETEEGLSILFEVRSEALSWQPGEVCFPGGRIEKTDSSPETAAVRECMEELNISSDNISVCGSLAVLSSPLGLYVHPYVGIIKDFTKISPCSDEVAEVFTIPIATLLTMEPRIGKVEVATRPQPNNFPFDLLPGHPHDWNLRSRYELNFLVYKEFVIWGITAHILKGFLKKYKSLF